MGNEFKIGRFTFTDTNGDGKFDKNTDKVVYRYSGRGTDITIQPSSGTPETYQITEKRIGRKLGVDTDKALNRTDIVQAESSFIRQGLPSGEGAERGTVRVISRKVALTENPNDIVREARRELSEMGVSLVTSSQSGKTSFDSIQLTNEAMFNYACHRAAAALKEGDLATFTEAIEEIKRYAQESRSDRNGGIVKSGNYRKYVLFLEQTFGTEVLKLMIAFGKKSSEIDQRALNTLNGIKDFFTAYKKLEEVGIAPPNLLIHKPGFFSDQVDWRSKTAKEKGTNPEVVPFPVFYDRFTRSALLVRIDADLKNKGKTKFDSTLEVVTQFATLNPSASPDEDKKLLDSLNKRLQEKVEFVFAETNKFPPDGFTSEPNSHLREVRALVVSLKELERFGIKIPNVVLPKSPSNKSVDWRSDSAKASKTEEVVSFEDFYTRVLSYGFKKAISYQLTIFNRNSANPAQLKYAGEAAVKILNWLSDAKSKGVDLSGPIQEAKTRLPSFFTEHCQALAENSGMTAPTYYGTVHRLMKGIGVSWRPPQNAIDAIPAEYKGMRFIWDSK